jgi:hypothetical protein
MRALHPRRASNPPQPQTVCTANSENPPAPSTNRTILRLFVSHWTKLHQIGIPLCRGYARDLLPSFVRFLHDITGLIIVPENEALRSHRKSAAHIGVDRKTTCDARHLLLPTDRCCDDLLIKPPNFAAQLTINFCHSASLRDELEEQVCAPRDSNDAGRRNCSSDVSNILQNKRSPDSAGAIAVLKPGSSGCISDYLKAFQH